MPYFWRAVLRRTELFLALSAAGQARGPSTHYNMSGSRLSSVAVLLSIFNIAELALFFKGLRSLLTERSGRRMPPVERSALYHPLLVEPGMFQQCNCCCCLFQEKYVRGTALQGGGGWRAAQQAKTATRKNGYLGRVKASCGRSPCRTYQ